jgi:hypothetical protein
MVAGFVQQSGGAFSIDSEPGRGTRIDLILPATRAEQEDDVLADPEHVPAIAIGSVLVVDDDESVRLILSEQLRDLGLEVTVAEDGRHALEVIEQAPERPDSCSPTFRCRGSTASRCSRRFAASGRASRGRS